MLLIRRFEDSSRRSSRRARSTARRTSTRGQEAVAVGVASVLSDDDRVAGTYRGHGHALALGVEPQALLDEMLGRATGVCGGRAGSMNVVDLEHGLIGCFGIIGGSIAAATGAALALRAQRRRGGRVLRRRHGEPRLLPRVPELRQGASRCRSCTSARTTSTASSRRWRTSPPGEIRRAPEAMEIPAEHDRRQRRLGGAGGRRGGASSRARAGEGPPVHRGADLPLRRPLA